MKMKTRRKMKLPRKARNVRGGFSLPTGPSTTKYMRNAAETIIRQNAAKAADPTKYAKVGMRKLKQAAFKVMLKNTIIQIAKEASILGNDKTSSTLSEQTKAGGTYAANIGNTFKTYYAVGELPSSSVEAAEVIGGSRELNVYDTQEQGLSATDRKSLSPSTGFNQKRVIAWEDICYWTYQDLMDIGMQDSIGDSYWDNSISKAQITKWLTKNFTSRYKMYNKNKYLPVTIKITLCRVEDKTRTPIMAMSDTVRANLPSPSSSNEGVLPFNEQLTGTLNTTTSFSYGIDPEIGQLSHSAVFRETFTKVKTFKKTLLPGEVWDFEYKHHTGSGIDIQKLLNIESASGGSTYSPLASVFFYPIFEMWGPTVEAVASDDFSESYMGTAPGSVLFGFQKKAEIVTAQENQDTVAAWRLQSGGGASTRWAYKTYTSLGQTGADSSVRRINNINAEDILAEGEALAPGKFFIPVTTEMNVARAGTDNNAGTPEPEPPVT